MKKIFLTFLCCLLFIPALFAQQEINESVNYVRRNVEFGFKAGFNFATFRQDEILDAETLVGLNLGLFGRYRFSDYLSVKPEVMYSMQGARSDDFAIFEDYAINLNYLKIPVLAEFSIADRFRLELGPYIGFVLVSRQSFKELNDSGLIDVPATDHNSVDVGASGGAIFQFSDRFGLGARYSYGFVDALGSDFLGNGNNAVLQVSGFYSF